MTRSRMSAKQAGTRHERAVADYLRTHVSEFVDRRVKTGAKDRGDIANLRTMGERVVVECKDYARLMIGPWLNEAEIERRNDSAMAGVVVAKRVGKGQPGDQIVLMTLRDLVALLTGIRPDDEEK